MAERQEIWEALLESGFLHALSEAHEATTRIVFGALSRSAGFKERSFGYTSFDVLESQLDRVFELGPFAPAPAGRESGSAALPGVARDNLNGSAGWRYGPYRILLKRHDFGAVDTIRWDQLSSTKQAVAKQEYGEDPQLSLDLGIERDDPFADVQAPLTLVLAHSATEAPLEMELFLGRPRFNADGGSAWWWRLPLTPDTLGPDPRRGLAEPTVPLWGDDEDDVALRPRARGRDTDAETAK
ncbi:hypothetical protein ACRYCC_33395 [Actinomadura scrupuli]|uniref:hypothetical protein n=1 Tax=Actinomadura scrupuli TaxID=559629 RepID=UPI003D99B0D3